MPLDLDGLYQDGVEAGRAESAAEIERMNSPCKCDWLTGECQGPLGCKAVAEIVRLRALLPDPGSELEIAHLTDLCATLLWENKRLQKSLEIWKQNGGDVLQTAAAIERLREAAWDARLALGLALLADGLGHDIKNRLRTAWLRLGVVAGGNVQQSPSAYAGPPAPHAYSPQCGCLQCRPR